MKEAYLYERIEDGKIRCNLCSHRCKIAQDKRGICQVRENREEKLYSLVYGRLISRNVDPIEKKPLFHFLPGSRSYSIATVGCNFRCLHCQNWQISQYPRLNNGEILGEQAMPEEIVQDALISGAKSISYTYVEPTIFFEMAYETGKIARSRGIKNIFVSNGYMTPETNKMLTEFLDGINIDLKAFTDRFYKEVCKARLQPVLDSIKQLHEAGVWVEVTTLIIPGWNDSEEELRDIARFIKGVSESIPWHVTAFHPTYKMMDRPPTPASILRRAREIGLEEGLRFVYEGNIPGEGGENTYCPACKAVLISRYGFSILENRLGEEGRCPECGEEIQGVWK
jgi:pyruvate formate lyase activating enzyme